MIDSEFVAKLRQLYAAGIEGQFELREMLHTQTDRLLTLAEAGVGRARRVPTAKKTSLPDNFPGEQEMAWAIEFWPQHGRADLVPQGADQAEAFRDHHTKENNRFASWPAAWRTWVRNSLQFTKAPREFPGGAPFEQTTAAGWIGRLETHYYGGVDVKPGFWLAKWGPKPGEAGCRAPAAVISAVRGRTTA